MKTLVKAIKGLFVTSVVIITSVVVLSVAVESSTPSPNISPEQKAMVEAEYGSFDQVPSEKIESEYSREDYDKKQAQEEQLVARLKLVPASNFKLNQQLYAQLKNLFPNNQKYQAKFEYYNDKHLAVVDAKREENLLAMLKTIPASQVENNLNKYYELLELRPSNTRYQAKVTYYQGKLRAQRSRIHAQQAKYGDAPVKSWNGSYAEIDNYLQRVAHNPKSVDVAQCTQALFDKTAGWVVGCEYRAKNAFGGLVLAQDWFTIIHNEVIHHVDVRASNYVWP